MTHLFHTHDEANFKKSFVASFLATREAEAYHGSMENRAPAQVEAAMALANKVWEEIGENIGIEGFNVRVPDNYDGNYSDGYRGGYSDEYDDEDDAW